MADNQLGTYLRGLREAKGLSTRQLARAADCSQPSITRLESGVRLPSLTLLWEIVKVLNGDFGEALFLLCLDIGIPEAVMRDIITKYHQGDN